jgi:hypothetical protein
MARISLVVVLCLTLEAVAGEPIAPPIDSYELKRFLAQARDLAVKKTEGVDPADLTDGYLTPYYPSRKSVMPGGSLVSFTVRGSQRQEKLGESEDRILVIFPDGGEPEVKQITVLLRDGLGVRTR